MTYSDTNAANKSFLSRFARLTLNKEDTYMFHEKRQIFEIYFLQNVKQVNQEIAVLKV